MPSSLPWELALPRGQPRHGTPWRRFPSNAQQSRTEQTEGVYPASPTLGRDQGCWSASRQLSPAHPGTLLLHRPLQDAGATRSVPKAGGDCLPLGSSIWGTCWELESGSWGSPQESPEASALFDTRKTSGCPWRCLLNSLILLFCASCGHEIQPDSLQLARKYNLIHYSCPSIYTHLDENKKRHSRRKSR